MSGSQNGEGAVGFQANPGQVLVRQNPDDADAAAEQDFKPLTREQAWSWRAANPAASPWRVLLGQLLAGVLVTLLAWLVTGESRVAWSAAYGALAVVVPGALFIRGLERQQSARHAGAAMVGFFVWEAVKIVLTVAMLLAAPRIVVHLSWLALLAGFVVTMKVSWLAVWWRVKKPASVA